MKKCKYCKENSGDRVGLHFRCPKDGMLHQRHIYFLCNKCSQDELEFIKGVYMCPQCLEKPDSFECRICGSTKVKLIG